jgi:hypothetical protein
MKTKACKACTRDAVDVPRKFRKRRSTDLGLKVFLRLGKLVSFAGEPNIKRG